MRSKTKPVPDEAIYTEVGFKLNKMRISVKFPRSKSGRARAELKKESSFKSYNSSSLIQSIRNRGSSGSGSKETLDVTAWRWQPSPNGSFSGHDNVIDRVTADSNDVTRINDPAHTTLRARANVNFIRNDLRNHAGTINSDGESDASSRGCQLEVNAAQLVGAMHALSVNTPPPVPPRHSPPSTPPPSIRPPYPSSTVSRTSHKSKKHHQNVTPSSVHQRRSGSPSGIITQFAAKKQSSSQFQPISGSALESARRKYYL